jgi:hypothetical protein
LHVNAQNLFAEFCVFVLGYESRATDRERPAPRVKFIVLNTLLHNFLAVTVALAVAAKLFPKFYASAVDLSPRSHS